MHRLMLTLITTFIAAAGMLIPGVAYASPGWIVICPHDHSLPADPIVAPGDPMPFWHLHDFFGAKDTNPDSDYHSMQKKGTSCAPRYVSLGDDDFAGYWVPALYQNGVQILAGGGYFNGRRLRQQMYYRDHNLTSGTRVEAFPSDFRMIAGNARASNESENPRLGREIYFGCSDNSTSKLKAPPSSCSTGIMTLHVGFPNCWDGVNLDSPTHQSHVTYPSSSKCPSSHPVALPRLIMRFEYPVGTTTGTITLASGKPYTAHGDFWNTWKQETLEFLVEECLNADVDCGSFK